MGVMKRCTLGAALGVVFRAGISKSLKLGEYHCRCLRLSPAGRALSASACPKHIVSMLVTGSSGQSALQLFCSVPSHSVPERDCQHVQQQQEVHAVQRQ